MVRLAVLAAAVQMIKLLVEARSRTKLTVKAMLVDCPRSVAPAAVVVLAVREVMLTARVLLVLAVKALRSILILTMFVSTRAAVAVAVRIREIREPVRVAVVQVAKVPKGRLRRLAIPIPVPAVVAVAVIPSARRAAAAWS